MEKRVGRLDVGQETSEGPKPLPDLGIESGSNLPCDLESVGFGD